MSSPPASTIQIQLAPKPGFCIKTSTLPGAVLTLPNGNGSEPSSRGPTSVPEGLKVFVNIAWDINVPLAPKGSEEAILRAINGEDVEDSDADGLYIPAIVSSVREDRDKAGNPSLVFDCIYNTALKARLTSAPEVKDFLVELALQRIESQTGLVLSRELRMPNISSKGKLLPRTARVPASLLLETPLATEPPVDTTPATNSASAPSAFEDEGVPTTVSEFHSNSPEAATSLDSKDTAAFSVDLPPLDWSWTKEDDGRLRIEITEIPDITPSLIQASTLDIESHSLTLRLPDRGSLHFDLDLSDAEIASEVKSLSALRLDGASETWEEEETMRRLKLKRERDFEIEKADAEWMVGTRTMRIYV